MIMTIKSAHFHVDKEIFGKQDPYIEFTYDDVLMRTETIENGGKNPIFDKEYRLDDVEKQWLKELVFTAKDEDMVGFKFLGSSDPNYRLIDTINQIKDFEPFNKEIILYEEGKPTGHIDITFQAISGDL